MSAIPDPNDADFLRAQRDELLGRVASLEAELAKANDLLLRIHPDILEMRLDPVHNGHSFHWSVKCIDCVPTQKRRRELERMRKAAKP